MWCQHPLIRYQYQYHFRYHKCMPALNLTFTDDEMATLRAAASAHQLSLKAFAHDAVLASSSEHARRVSDAARRIAERSAELNKRLA